MTRSRGWLTSWTDPGTGEELIIVDQYVFGETYYQPGLDFPDYVTEPYSKDLAFALYAIPEPGTMLVLGLGLVPAVLRRARRR